MTWTLQRRDHDGVCADIQLEFVQADRRPRHQRLVPAPSMDFEVGWAMDVHTHVPIFSIGCVRAILLCGPGVEEDASQ